MDYSLRQLLNDQVFRHPTSDPGGSGRDTDARGGVQLGAAESINCYIVHETNIFTNARGEEVISTSKFFADGPLNPSGFDDADLISETVDGDRYKILRIIDRYDYKGNLDYYEVYY